MIFSIEHILQPGSIEAIEAEYRRANCGQTPLTIIDDPDHDNEQETSHG